VISTRSPNRLQAEEKGKTERQQKTTASRRREWSSFMKGNVNQRNEPQLPLVSGFTSGLEAGAGTKGWAAAGAAFTALSVAFGLSFPLPSPFFFAGAASG
jgi:hypothetical protein